MIGNFPTAKTFNPGGLRSFKFILFNQVDAYPMIIAGKSIVELSLIAGADWITGYSTYESLQFTEAPDENENGPFYNPKLSGFVPGDSDVLISLMEEMQQWLFLVLTTDASGLVRLLGTPANPLSFSAKYDSSAERSGLKGYTFEFSGLALFRAPNYPF